MILEHAVCSLCPDHTLPKAGTLPGTTGKFNSVVPGMRADAQCLKQNAVSQLAPGKGIFYIPFLNHIF